MASELKKLTLAYENVTPQYDFHIDDLVFTHAVGDMKYNSLHGVISGPPDSSGKYPVFVEMADGTKCTLHLFPQNMHLVRRGL
eukprot:CAMPEP_0185035600 /NCGR_PEP_ID=MMETSP1103-20130426/27272_1 /TAXON_ID=36769 /ORGANISM="Paraphysomonas bandaiensis, Strain Caron Lab Isolate" /LENGTH=82 /DNA_ID=CAMNT_0027572755 /DNA_START=35 /DNA_END=283 /DNA_ORIENTATION=+